MLKQLDKQLVHAIVGATLTVLFALLSIDVLAKMIDEADIVGDGSYSFAKMAAYVFGLLPLKLTQFFPMSLLVGALMGLGKLAAGNELTIMQMANISRLRIGLVGFLVALVMGSIVVLASEFGGVAIKQHVVQLRAEALGKVTQQFGASGVWAQDGNHFIHIKGGTPDGKLSDVRIYSLDDDMQIAQIRHAVAAEIHENRWELSQITQKTLGSREITVEEIAQATWDNQLDSNVIEVLLSNPEDLSIRDLYRYIRYQKANGIESANYSLVFWQRLFIPLSTGVMFLLALPFVFGSQRNTSQGRKLFLGVMLGLIYYVTYTSIANIILLTGVAVIWGALIPIMLFAAMSFGLLWVKG